jgi:hypothetical protein
MSIAQEFGSNAKLYAKYAREVSSDFLWMMLSAPRFGDNLRALMVSEAGRHMYTKHKKIALQLLRRYNRNNGIKVFDNIQRVKRDISSENPVTITFGILGQDWPGMIDAVAGVIHEAGFNLSSSRSISIIKDKDTLGFVALEILVASDDEIKSLIRHRDEIRKNLEIAAQKDPWIIHFQKEHTRIYKKYRDCKRILIERNRSDLFDELGRFFEDRPDTYLENRSPEDLIEQIIANQKILEEAKKDGKEIGIAIGNLKNVSTGNEITGVSIAADAKKITFEGILDVLEHLFPNSHLVFDYNFTEQKSNKILYHVEFTKSDGSVLTGSETKQLQTHLERLTAQKSLSVWTSIEPFYRIICRGLQKEFCGTGVPQILVCPLPQGKDKYRVILVISKGSIKRQFAEVIAENMKLELIIARPPLAMVRKTVKDELLTHETYVLDIRADAIELSTPYLIHQEIIRTIKSVIEGELRDYDKTGRDVVRSNLATAAAILAKNSIPENFVQTVLNTANIADEFLFIATPKEIAEQIILGHELFMEFSGEKNRPIIGHSPSLIGIGFSFDENNYLEKCIEKLGQYSWYMSRLDLEAENFSIVIFKIKKSDGTDLSNDEFEALKQKIQESSSANSI